MIYHLSSVFTPFDPTSPIGVIPNRISKPNLYSLTSQTGGLPISKLKRDHNFRFSESTVGRVLNYLKDNGKITKSISAVRPKRKHNFKKHAKALVYKRYEEMEMGEYVQIDRMTVTKNCVKMKHFQAWKSKSKTLIAQLYSSAKSSDAKKFLQELVAKAPYKIKSIQVDGGSEFMADFEDEYSKLNIPLHVLPPATPKYNGDVERANRTLREEFYRNPKLLTNSIRDMQIELQKILKKYNECRPHAGLNGLTPAEYILAHSVTTSQSQSI